MAPEFRFFVSTEEAYLTQEVKFRAAANRSSLDKRLNDNTVQTTLTKEIVDRVTPAIAGAKTDGGYKYARLIPANELLSARRRTKGGSILYVFIFDENSEQSGHTTDYQAFTSKELYTEVFNGFLVQIFQDNDTVYPAIPIPGWDQPSVILYNRTGAGMYDELSTSSTQFNILSNIADYSIIYFVIDSSGSMTPETVEAGVKEFFTDLTENIVNRPQQRFLFQSSELEATLAIAGTTNKSGDWFLYESLEAYLEGIDERDAYRSTDTLLVMVAQDPRERAVLPAQDLFDWLGDEELEFYKTVNRA